MKTKKRKVNEEVLQEARDILDPETKLRRSQFNYVFRELQEEVRRIRG